MIRLAEMAVTRQTPGHRGYDRRCRPSIHRLESPWAVQYSQTLTWIAKNPSTDENLMQLEPPGPTYLLQILLAFGAYTDLAHEMLHQARLIYPGDKQTEYINMVRQIFAETPQNTEQVPLALKTIGEVGIRSLPLAMAYIGALEGHEWSSELDAVAENATKMLFDNPAILEVIPSAAMIALLKFHIKRKDVPSTIRVAGLLPQVAIHEGSKGISLIGRMYKCWIGTNGCASPDWNCCGAMSGRRRTRTHEKRSRPLDASSA